MRSYSAATVVLGLAASTVVSAAPTLRQPLAKRAVTPLLPLKDGFPTPNDQQLDTIQNEAFGTLPNGAPPATLSDDTLTSVRLIAFSETVESAFFAELISNITSGVQGYTNIPNRNFTLNALQSMLAAEELHAINAQNALQHFGKDQIQPCQYNFPVATFDDAIAFISTTTDFVQGVLGDVINKAASAADAGFTRGVAGALSNEGEQDGFFRFLLNMRPNQKVFNTISTREYAFSLLQDLIVPGSCPNTGEIDLPVFQPLAASNPPAQTTDITFTFSLTPTRAIPSASNAAQNSPVSSIANFASQYGQDWTPLAITFLNGQNAPASQPIKSLTIDTSTQQVTAVAEFPFDQFKMFGLSVAALTVGNNFASQDDMVKATLFGPALLETQE